jgi:hypothetical protein
MEMAGKVAHFDKIMVILVEKSSICNKYLDKL